MTVNDDIQERNNNAVKKLLKFQVSHRAIVSSSKISGQKRSSRAVSLFCKTSAT